MSSRGNPSGSATTCTATARRGTLIELPRRNCDSEAAADAVVTHKRVRASR